MTDQLRLMAVHAHPDDESSKGAATMAKYVSEGVDVLVVLGWFGYHYVVGNKISAEIITFKTYDDSVRVHLEVRKDSGTNGYCTVRSQAENGAEVGRADFRFDGAATRIDRVVTLRTTSQGTTAELLGCHTA